MINSGKLAGRTLFITGASRGIGKAIAIKAARDGANIVIAAKTAEPHPKLPGTIYTAAEEIEKAGGKAHPCIVDVRDEAQVRNAVTEAVAKFGGIDILVNNASAISLTGTLATEMKRYDLMHGINTRGTFLVSKECLPHLLKSNHAHILNISPPLNLNPRWFGPHVAYTMAKYGMSMCVLGMSHEFKDQGVAVNALWPRTAIQTAAMEMLAGSESAKWSRKVDIMSDAAYAILVREPKQTTGQFLIDDEVLAEAGIEDLKQYACHPENADKLLEDFFLEPRAGSHTIPIESVKYQSSAGVTSAPAAGSQSGPASSGKGSVSSIFAKIEGLLSAEVVDRTKAVYQFNITGDQAGTWFLDLKNGTGSCGTGEPKTTADATLTMKGENFYEMFTGKLKPAPAFMTGKLAIKGDMQKAMKLDKLMKALKEQEATAAPAAAAQSAAADSGKGGVSSIFAKIEGLLSAEIVDRTKAVYQFNITGEQEGTWFLDLKNGTGSCGTGAPKVAPDATLTMKGENFFDMFTGKLKPAPAFMTGKLAIKGDMQKAMKLDKLMKALKEKA